MNNEQKNLLPISKDSLYRLLVESISDYAIYMLSPNGAVVSWNLGAERFKGYSESEIVGRHFSCFYVVEDRAAGLPEAALAIAARDGRFEARAGASGRMAAIFGRMSLSTPFATPVATCLATPRSPAI
jgi:PAS domain-containing protein